MVDCNLGQAGCDQTNLLSVMDANKFHDVETTLIFMLGLNVQNLINYPEEISKHLHFPRTSSAVDQS